MREICFAVVTGSWRTGSRSWIPGNGGCSGAPAKLAATSTAWGVSLRRQRSRYGARRGADVGTRWRSRK
jgi:hypothetical protein